MILDLSRIHSRGATVEHCLDVFSGVGATHLILSCNDDGSSSGAFLHDPQLRELAVSGQLLLRLMSSSVSVSAETLTKSLDRAAFFDISRVFVSLSGNSLHPPSALAAIITQHIERNNGPEVVFEVSAAAEMEVYCQILQECGVHDLAQGPSFGLRRRIQTSAVGFVVIDDDSLFCGGAAETLLFSERCVGVVLEEQAQSVDAARLAKLLSLATPQTDVHLVLRIPFSPKFLHESQQQQVELQVDPLLDFVDSAKQLQSTASRQCCCSESRSAPLRALANDKDKGNKDKDNENDSSALSQCFRRDEALRRATGDVLQMPLRPDSELLSTATYEEFERDDVKYRKYEQAILAAMQQQLVLLVAAEQHQQLLVCVLGAGRGPLVSAALRTVESVVSTSSSSSVAVVAVERNPFAFEGLEAKTVNDPLWRAAIERNQLALVCGDGREQSVCERVQAAAVAAWGKQQQQQNQSAKQQQHQQQHLLVISELLGSFGDNELSPECIDGFLHSFTSARKEERGKEWASITSIPQEYTSFACLARAPLLSSSAVQHCIRQNGRFAACSPAFVVNAVRCSAVSETLPVFSFSHPAKEEQQRHERKTRLEFKPRDSSVVCSFTGLLGFFRCRLFGDVWLSTVPEDHTPAMHSWFPVYLPVWSSASLSTMCGDVVMVDFERNASGEIAWRLAS